MAGDSSGGVPVSGRRPGAEVALPEFYISRYPITQTPFRRLLRSRRGLCRKERFWIEAERRKACEGNRARSEGKRDWRTSWRTSGLRAPSPIDYGEPYSLPQPSSGRDHLVRGVSVLPLAGDGCGRGRRHCPPARAALPPGYRILLPTEAQWEKGERGGAEAKENATFPLLGAENFRPSRFPTGPKKKKKKKKKKTIGNTGIGSTSAVGCFPGGKSPYGAEEGMAGNVWEWTSSLCGDYPYPACGKEREKREDLDGLNRRLPGVARRRLLSTIARRARCAVPLLVRSRLRARLASGFGGGLPHSTLTPLAPLGALGLWRPGISRGGGLAGA